MARSHLSNYVVDPTASISRGLLRGFLLWSTVTLLGAVCPHAHAGLNSGPEYAALVNLFNSTNGAMWTNGSSGPNAWSLSTEACGWYGITCDQDTNPADNTSHVTGIVLRNNNLTGSLSCLSAASPCFSGLTHLTEFYVDRNQLTGSIPDLTGLTILLFFDVHSNQLTGLIPAAPDPFLVLWDVRFNRLTGSLPNLVGLMNLQVFSADSNKLTGSIPTLTGLTNLSTFSVSSNQLMGSIPCLSPASPCSSGLTNLQAVDVHSNHLTGSLPDLTGLSNVYLLNFDSNQLTGTIPTLTGLTSLQDFYVGNNQLTGVVPAAPSTLKAASLCSNPLNTTPQPTIDPAWDTATGVTPWWATPFASNKCDDLFHDGFGG